jgi:hypothetical protein
VLVCGDRGWDDRDAIQRELRALLVEYPDLRLCHGAARGADTLAGEAAVALGIPVAAFPANWAAFGKAAGPIRNRTMLREFKPELVVAFHADLSKSKGTRDMVEAARLAGVPVMHHRQ